MEPLAERAHVARLQSPLEKIQCLLAPRRILAVDQFACPSSALRRLIGLVTRHPDGQIESSLANMGIQDVIGPQEKELIRRQR